MHKLSMVCNKDKEENRLDVSAGVRIERSIFEWAMVQKKRALDLGEPSSYSTQSWFSMLVERGLREWMKENKMDSIGDRASENAGNKR